MFERPQLISTPNPGRLTYKPGAVSGSGVPGAWLAAGGASGVDAEHREARGKITGPLRWWRWSASGIPASLYHSPSPRAVRRCQAEIRSILCGARTAANDACKAPRTPISGGSWWFSTVPCCRYLMTRADLSVRRHLPLRQQDSSHAGASWTAGSMPC